MTVRSCLPMLLLVPILSLAESPTNSVSEVFPAEEWAEPVGMNSFTNEIVVETEENGETLPEREPVSISKLTYFVRQNDTGGRGSAFLLEDTNGVWLVSNVHVFGGSTNLLIINVEGDTIDVPAQIEIAEDRDILRFRTDKPQGLRLSSSCEYDEPICAYGDSGGAGVLTRLKGTAVAIGPDRIEISAEIIPGNSGGPVVNENSEVVGVSSYLFKHASLPDWITDGTRFTDTRRMAIKLDDVEWSSVEFTDFYEQTTALADFEGMLNTTIYIASVLSDGMSQSMHISTEYRPVESWLKRHNRYARDESEKSQKRVRSNVGRLAKLLEEKEAGPPTEAEITISFLKGRLADMKDACIATRRHLKLLSE